MSYRYFAVYNVTGALLWVLSFLLAGYWFGQIPAIKRNFHIVIVAIIVISVMPMVFEFVRARRAPAAT
jgi:membrane-associated protein